jgi:16S rRNA (guanine(527)-N(7))-methyltransferase RsmG
MFLPLEKIKISARELCVPLTDEALVRFDVYARGIAEYNEKINLTAITAPEDMAVKHFIDSLTLLSACDINPGASVVDVGTGAGFPGTVLLAARPDLDVTLIDSLKKRLDVIEILLEKTGLTATAVHIRAEDAGRGLLRESFDFVTARAVADMRVLAELCLPLCKKGGVFAAMKGPDAEEELTAARAMIGELGGAAPEIIPFVLPDGSRRSIVKIKKISQTPTAFPRRMSKINNKK